MLDIEKLTLGEIAKIEELSGSSISMLSEDETPKGKMLAAMALVAKRRDGFPNFKWNDALQLSISEANTIIGLDDEEDEGEPDPTPAAKKAAKKGSTPSPESS